MDRSQTRIIELGDRNEQIFKKILILLLFSWVKANPYEKTENDDTVYLIR